MDHNKRQQIAKIPAKYEDKFEIALELSIDMEPQQMSVFDIHQDYEMVTLESL